jgi:hypothetical protein
VERTSANVQTPVKSGEKTRGLAVEDARMVLCAVLAESVSGVTDMQEFYPGSRAAGREMVGAGADVVTTADLVRSGGRPWCRGHERLRLTGGGQNGRLRGERAFAAERGSRS